ncbi:hypothetical protein DKE47_016685 [Acinetobacter nosocomialis]|nr:hypothetical protein DKE47_016685 [Acinetobacter nosocomialis]
MVDVHSQLLILGVLPKHSFGIMVAERKRVDRLAQDPAHPKVSPFRPTATKRGDERVYIKKKRVFSMFLSAACQSRLAMWPARKA